MWTMENKVATQLFGLFPDVHNSWQLKSASRDRTYGGAEEGGEESEVDPADTVEKAAWEGPSISVSSPSFLSCPPGPSAGVSSSCIRNQDSLEQFMLPNPHWQTRPTPTLYLKVTYSTSSPLDNCSKGNGGIVFKWVNLPSVNATWNKPFNDRHICMALSECYDKI